MANKNQSRVWQYDEIEAANKTEAITLARRYLRDDWLPMIPIVKKIKAQEVRSE
ncbi:hypothetical protein [Endozoicomonas ascidiicola]|uniref:hypothetical protein n=1 Tax=Endozoicomonas ascidiicola TaxID=1698521 RepID=UPI000A72C9E6|nr:hypothetical protein [Endozoicomonas ascidiicola]